MAQRPGNAGRRRGYRDPMRALLFAGWLALAPAAVAQDAIEPSDVDPIPDRDPIGAPSVARDAVVLGAVTIGWATVNPNVRRGILTEGSVNEIVRNFRSPIRRALEGWRADTDGFFTNNVSHPLSWALVGLYLKDRGYGNLSALAFSQAHSVFWEYVLEGSYQRPSGRDLVANLVGAGAAIFALHPLRNRGRDLVGDRGPSMSLTPADRGVRLALSW